METGGTPVEPIRQRHLTPSLVARSLACHWPSKFGSKKGYVRSGASKACWVTFIVKSPKQGQSYCGSWVSLFFGN